MISVSHWGLFPLPLVPEVRRLEDVLPMYPKKRISEFFTTKHDDTFSWRGR